MASLPNVSDALQQLQEAESSFWVQFPQWMEPALPVQRRSWLVAMLQALEESNEIGLTAVARLWLYLTQQELSQPSLEDIKQQVHFVDHVQPALVHYQRSQTRKRHYSQIIQQHWGVWPDQVLVVDPAPASVEMPEPTLAYHCLRELAAWSAQGIARATAQSVLQQAIAHRQQQTWQHKQDGLLSQDVRYARQIQSQSDTVSASSATSAINPTISPSLTPSDCVQTPATSLASTPEPVVSCSCPDTLPVRQQTVTAPSLLAWMQTWGETHSDWPSQLCRRHRRAVCGTLNLRNNQSDRNLNFLLQQVRQYYQYDLTRMRQEHPVWFRQSVTAAALTDATTALVLYRHVPQAPTLSRWEPAQVFDRFLGAGCWQQWQQQGTVTMAGIFDYLRPWAARIDQEFALYRHHAAQAGGRARMGWARNMMFSLVQQVVRQDPVWYAITAAGRPDQNWRLITHPYISKDATEGEGTGFLHLDLAPARFVDQQVGGSLLTSSIALDEEDDRNCTLIVPGFHRHLPAWVAAMQARGDLPTQEKGSFNCQTTYRPEDQDRWGKPQPRPCPAYGLRLSRSELIHGSTKQAHRRRRSLFAWHRGVQEDLETLDLPDALTWTELARCHRQLAMPAREPQGQIPRPTPPPPQVFGGAIRLTGGFPLSEALIGGRQWDDPLVLHDVSQVLGASDEVAHAYVTRSRARLLTQWEEGWRQLQVVERAAYGSHAFFMQDSE